MTFLLLALASLRCCTTLLYCSSPLCWLLFQCYCSLVRYVSLIDVPDCHLCWETMKNSSPIQKSTKLVFLFKKSLTIMLWALQMKSCSLTVDESSILLIFSCTVVHQRQCVSDMCSILYHMTATNWEVCHRWTAFKSAQFPGEINAMIVYVCMPAASAGLALSNAKTYRIHFSLPPMVQYLLSSNITSLDSDLVFGFLSEQLFGIKLRLCLHSENVR